MTNRTERRRLARLGRTCEYCEQPIPVDRRVHARFCSEKCQRTNPRMRQYQCDKNRKRLYGITPEEFASLLESQNGCCAICQSAEPGGKGNWHVDHSHEDGHIRGLLCHHCNLLLGNAKDDPERLKAAIKYLEVS